jgi:carboxyl-terminal processing protease
MSRRNLALLFIAIGISLLCYGRGEQNPFARIVGLGYQEIDRMALEEPPDDELLTGAMRGMVDVLNQRGDEHSVYFDAQAAKPFLAEMQQEFGGVGVRLRMLGEPAKLTVVGPPEPGAPAERAGLRAGDTIVEINGDPTAGLSMEEVLPKMRGQVGEALTLLVQTGANRPRPVTMVRETIELPSVLGDRRLTGGGWEFRLEEEPRIALVRIATFGAKTVDELRTVLPRLEGLGVQALVLDLRENAGGALDAAVDICDFFLPKGALIVETRGRDAEVQDRYTATGGDFQNWPLAVVVDRNSASASEIVAACLQDHDRAAVVGERTFGKGTVQQLISVVAGRSVLKLTTASYWRPSGKNIHRRRGDKPEGDWGVKPDDGLYVSLTEEELAKLNELRSERDVPPAEGETPVEYKDPVLELAMKHLQGKLKKKP